MTRVATRENEAYRLQIVCHGTAAHVERLVCNYRKVQRIAERRRYAAFISRKTVPGRRPGPSAFRRWRTRYSNGRY